MAAGKKIKSSSPQMNGILRSSDMKQVKYKVLYSLLVLIMLLYVAAVVVPSIWMILSGLKDVTEMYAKPTHFFPKEIHISKLVDVWKQLRFYNYYVNTFALALGAMAFDVIFNGFAGYVLSRLKPRGSKVVYWLVLLLMMMPSTMSTVPLYKTFMGLGLLETYFPIWIMAGVNMFNIILFKTSFDSISNSLIEAAKIDGATNISIFSE